MVYIILNTVDLSLLSFIYIHVVFIDYWTRPAIINQSVDFKKMLHLVYMVCNRNQYWVLSSRSAKSWNNIKILMLFHDFHVGTWFVKSSLFLSWIKVWNWDWLIEWCSDCCKYNVNCSVLTGWVSKFWFFLF
jgi:hypothetical protein